MNYTIIALMVTFAYLLNLYCMRRSDIRSDIKYPVKIVFYFLILVSVLLISFRNIGIFAGEVHGGIDSLYYKEAFEFAKTDFFESLLIQGYEPGFGALVWMFSSIGLSYEYYQVIIYLFLFYSLNQIINKVEVNRYTALVVFMGLLIILGSVNLLRITLAITIFYFSLFYYIKGKNYIWISLSMVSMTIHISSFVPVLALLFVHMTRNFKGIVYVFFYTITIIAIYIFSFYFMSNFLAETKYNVYIESEDTYSLNTYIFGAFIVFIYKYMTLNAHNRYVKTMMSFVMTLFLTLPIYLAFPIGYRFILFYLPAIYFVLPSFLKYYAKISWTSIVNIPIYISLLLFMFLKIYFTYRDDLINWGFYSINI